MPEISMISNLRYEYDHGGQSHLSLEIDGRATRLYYEQKLLRFGAVFLGPDFDDFSFVLAADPDDGRPEPEEMRGFSNDVRLVRLATKLRDDIDSGRFRPGVVKV